MGDVGVRGARGDEVDQRRVRANHAAPPPASASPCAQSSKGISWSASAAPVELDQHRGVGHAAAKSLQIGLNERRRDDPAVRGVRGAAHARPAPPRYRRRHGRPDCLDSRPWRAHHAPSRPSSPASPRFVRNGHWRTRKSAEPVSPPNRSQFEILSFFISMGFAVDSVHCWRELGDLPPQRSSASKRV